MNKEEKKLVAEINTGIDYSNSNRVWKAVGSWSYLKRKEAIQEVIKIVKNWDIEPCCHGIKQDELLRELEKLK